MIEKDNVQRHPAYGVAQVNRVSGGNRDFFGTSYKPDQYIEFIVYPGESYVSEFGEFQINTANRKEIFSMRMTSHQFSNLIMNMNVGPGTTPMIELIFLD